MSSTTDKDALVVSQIAYMNIENVDIENAVDRYGSATLENIFEVSKGKVEKDYIERVYGNKDSKTTKLSEYEQMRLEEAKAFIEEIKNSEYAQWEIVEVKDDNADAGFYGCMIDCGDGQAILGLNVMSRQIRIGLSENIKISIWILWMIMNTRMSCTCRSTRHGHSLLMRILDALQERLNMLEREQKVFMPM